MNAIFTDVERFYAQCDPDKENLCLYGNPDGTWEVQLPAEEVPPELPEPALGINFARDGMQVRARWVRHVRRNVRALSRCLRWCERGGGGGKISWKISRVRGAREMRARRRAWGRTRRDLGDRLVDRERR